MKICLTLTLVVSLIFGAANGFSSGPSQSACGNLRPQGLGGAGHSNAVFRDLGFAVQPSSPTFRSGETLTVQLSGNPGQSYRGIFLQVRNGEDLGSSSAVGSWVIENSQTPNFRSVDCAFFNFPSGSALGHRNAIDKPTPERFMWTAPDCTDGQPYFIKATVVVQRLLIQEGISAPIICRNPTVTPRPTPTLPRLTITTTTTTTTPEPTPPSGGCRFTSLTNIPIEYTTSFENRDNPFRGWNVISSGSYRWTAQSGPTPSAFTGPSRADDGDFYIFTEASSPAQPGDTTIIETQENLRGCFCLRLAYSFIVYGAGQTLALEIGGNEIRSETSLANQFSQNSTAPEWRQANIPLDLPNFVRIRIIATRGQTWLGDMALDNIFFTPGSC